MFRSKLKPRLLAVPAEIKEMIFCSLPDLQTLQNVIETHPIFKETFENRPSYILTHVLSQTIPPAVFPEAYASLRAVRVLDSIPRIGSRRRIPSEEQIKPVLDDYFQDKEIRCFKHKITFQDAIQIEGFFQKVHALTISFIETAFSSAILSKKRSKSHIRPISTAEFCRFYTAFYRFDLYCLLLASDRNKQDFNMDWELFLSHFAPWEIEQIGCVHDFLWSQINEPFKDVASHDIEWGDFYIEWLDDEPSDYLSGICNWKLNFLASGIEFLHSLIGAKTYKERWMLLNSRRKSRLNFLHEALNLTQHPSRALLARKYNMEFINCYSERPCSVDRDRGPYKTWKTAYALSDGRHAMWFQLRAFRDAAYVMWDDARIERWDDGHGLGVFSSIPPLSNLSSIKAIEEQRQSFIRRDKLWMEGARGWWSRDDESKVVYNNGSTIFSYFGPE
ncbi:hypothetical protein FQN57_000689 [Myotisia sp. PD_48]|nr:hypothetical protein FQN57_000689 [Myotisia sp. PD_48]